MEVVDTKTGEIIDESFIPYKKIRHVWKREFLSHLVKKQII